ncbi:MAG: Hsp20/alpha crystallin family protein [Planctomycetota bacterium]|nr:Hsp20/alpha crystallin family protein [Planctomycetota bacterium]
MSFFGKYYFASAKHLAGESEESSLQEWSRLGSAAGIPQAWSPAADMYETAAGLVVLLDVSGCRPEDLRLQIEGDTLIVRGVRCDRQPREKRVYRLMEIHHGPFERRIALSRPVHAAAGRATLRDGMLEIFLPFRQEPTVVSAVSLLRIEWFLDGRNI